MAPFDLLILVLVALLSFGFAYLGASVGLVLGQLRLPVLVYWLGSPVVGAGTSLAISTVAALVGAIRHARGGRVSIRLMVTIGVPSAAAAFVTARFATDLDPALIKAAIGVALLVTAAFMLRKPASRPTEEQPGQPTASESQIARADPPNRRIPIEVAVGGVLGAIAGLVGLLMGTLRLPIMLRLGAGPARAVGTNLAIGSATGVFAGIATVMQGSIDWTAFAVVTPTTMLGAYLGATATGRMEKRTLRAMIAVTLIGVGAWMLSELWRSGA